MRGLVRADARLLIQLTGFRPHTADVISTAGRNLIVTGRVGAQEARFLAPLEMTAFVGRERSVLRRMFFLPLPLAGGEAETDKGPADLCPAERAQVVFLCPGGNRGEGDPLRLRAFAAKNHIVRAPRTSRTN